MSDFKGKVALVCGAGRGFGRALAVALAGGGAAVAANDLTPINVDEVVREINAGGGQARSYLADVSKKLALQTMLNEVLGDWERIDILVNAASVQPHDRLLEMDEWDWHRTLDVILTGAFLSTQSVGRVMVEQGGGVVLNVGPVDAGEASPEPRAAYLAAKAGLLALTQAAAQELASDNIRLNAITFSSQRQEQALQQALELCRGETTGEVFEV